MDAPTNFPFKQRGIQFSLSLFSSFFPFFKCISFRPPVHQNAFPFRPQVSSQLSNQTAAVNSTRAQSSSSTQQPRDRYTALLSPAVDLLLSLKLIYHAALLSPAVDLLPFAVGLPRSSTPPLATDLLYLQHNSPSTRQYTDFPCSRSLTQQRQAET